MTAPKRPTVKYSIQHSPALVHSLLLSVLLKVCHPSPSNYQVVFTNLSLPVNPGSSVWQPESACEQVIYSSGGFSNQFAMPKYQEDVVKDYLKNYPPPYSSSTFNCSGNSRAFPDLSANGANYVVSVSRRQCRYFVVHPLTFMH